MLKYAYTFRIFLTWLCPSFLPLFFPSGHPYTAWEVCAGHCTELNSVVLLCYQNLSLRGVKESEKSSPEAEKQLVTPLAFTNPNHSRGQRYGRQSSLL